MFSVPPIRTKNEHLEPAQIGYQPHAPEESDAWHRTKALLESTVRQQQYVMASKHLPSDVLKDELAALSLLRSFLTELNSCILEHDHPPPSVSKRTALIKVEKARRKVLNAVRECGSRVTESQMLLEEVARFIELRPDEPVSPKQLGIKWHRQPQPREILTHRDQAPTRNLRVADSLAASIIGLTAIAEGRLAGDRSTPTSDAAGPTYSFGAARPLGAAQPLGHPRYGEQRARGLASGGKQQPRQHGYAGVSPTAQAASAAAGSGGGGGGGGVAAMMQQLRIAADGDEDDLRPALQLDVAQSSATSTSMCNLDSCAAPASGAATAGVHHDDDVEDEDEVTSAEARCCGGEGSPNHRVHLLGPGGNSATFRGPAAFASTATTTAAAAQQSVNTSGAAGRGSAEQGSAAAVQSWASGSHAAAAAHYSQQQQQSHSNAPANITPQLPPHYLSTHPHYQMPGSYSHYQDLPSSAHASAASGHAYLPHSAAGTTSGHVFSPPASGPSSLRDYPTGPHQGGGASGTSRGGTGGALGAPGESGSGMPPMMLGASAGTGVGVGMGGSMGAGRFGTSGSGYPSMDGTAAWDNVSLADTEPLPGAADRRGRRGGRRRGGGLLGLVRHVVGFVGVSVLSGAAMALGAAALNTGLDEQEAAQQARKRQGGRRGSRVGRGGGDLIPQSTLQQLRSPDLLALGRG